MTESILKSGDPLRELLSEIRSRWLIVGYCEGKHEACARCETIRAVDGVLAQPSEAPPVSLDHPTARAALAGQAIAQEPELVAIVFERDLGKDVQCMDGGDFKEVMVKELTPGVLKRGVKLYAAPPSAATLIAEKERLVEEVRHLSAECERNQGLLADAMSAHTHCPHCNPCRFTDKLEAAERALSELIAFYETTPEMNQHPIWKRARAALSSKALAENAGQIKAPVLRQLLATAPTGAGRLLDKVARKILENATHQHELTQIASEIGQYLGWTPGGMATDHERSGK